MTEKYCVMGNPIAHSRSPWIHTRFAELTGQPVIYSRQLVDLNAFPEAVKELAAQGGKGCNITVPFKLEAANLATTKSERVTLAGAANTLTLHADGTINADNTDGLGIVADITRNAGVKIAGQDVLLIGAGGAAAGVLGPLLREKPRCIVIANRTVEKAQHLADSHAAIAKETGTALAVSALDVAITEDFDIVINGTASSLAGAESPVPASVLRQGSLAYDMMYGEKAQGFLDWATRNGAVARDGLGMLVEQAAESFAIWRGVRPPAEQVLRELRAEIAAGR
ncbi:shikimate dehydrogenase [Diaphorobacter sp. HDW4B]|uniref:shikimate dehydrogenase n=1 Tax=Diaphorobacter sp. HDW4B TaxID=2714925 RepID=UPI0014092F7C|nr:shikimate dehydrogenase [Diaphorobacter sp. HDW4B]QIL71555.1 shikimate dehydrogenase [Diaphorobacter sp. HDW4B]